MPRWNERGPDGRFISRVASTRWSVRGRDGRFVSRESLTRPPPPSRRGVSLPVRGGARPLPNAHVGESFLVHLYSTSALDRRTAYRLFRARGGTKGLFDRKWRVLKKNPDLTTDRRISKLGARQTAELRGMPFKTYWRLHVAGLKRYWLRVVTDEALIEEYYGKGTATIAESDSLPAPKGA